MNRFVVLLLMCVTATAPLRAAADIYIRPLAVSNDRLNVVVGNFGATPNVSRFDAVLEVRSAAGVACRASTNFITPLEPQSFVLTFAVRIPQARSAETTYTVSARIQFWDEGDGNKANDSTTVTLRMSAIPQCLTLKPPQ